MKKAVIAGVLFGAAVISISAQSRPVNLATLVVDSELSREELDGMLLMREEEKLARDVYMHLSEVWNLRVFGNIARSEQTHMDRMADLLDAYGIGDPIVAGGTPGVFTNPVLAGLYEELTARGERSPQDALEVGRDIEILDIRDLEGLLEGTDSDAIHLVYGNLLGGSRNHLAAFERQLSRY